MIDDATIRSATADDEPAIKGCVIAAYAKYVGRIGRRPAPMFADYLAAIVRGEVFVRGEPLCGFVVLIPATDHIFLETIAVSPQLQRRGHGRALMAFAEGRALELGLSEVRLYTGECMWENRKMYRRLGYEEFDRRAENGYPRIFFKKILENGRQQAPS
ncbi:MAG: GNAT family N-acetyltransferase [Actinomycetota bacterium]